MIVTTKKAAGILGISGARLRVLLAQGLLEGAYKCGRMWLIPLFDGRPFISKGILRSSSQVEKSPQASQNHHSCQRTAHQTESETEPARTSNYSKKRQ